MNLGDGKYMYPYMMFFDFTEFKNPFMSGNTAKETLLWVANDAAYVDMMLGMLDEVTVEINMFDTY